MSPQPNTRVVNFEGKRMVFPADATDDEIRQALSGFSAPADKGKAPFVSPLRSVPVLGKPLGWVDENLVEPGFNRMAGGFSKILQPSEHSDLSLGERVAGGGSDILRGAAQSMGLPFALMNPQAALMSIPGGVAGEAVGHGLGAITHAGPEYSNALGDLFGVGAGGATAQLKPSLVGMKGAAKAMFNEAADTPFVGKLLKIPAAGFKGYNEAVNPTIPELPRAPAPTHRLSTSPYNPQPEIPSIPAPTNRLSTSPYNPQPEAPRAPAPTSRLSTSPYNDIPPVPEKRVMPWGPRMSTSPYNPKVGESSDILPTPAPVAPIRPVAGATPTPVTPTGGSQPIEGIPVSSIPQQKAHDMIGDWQATKNQAAAEQAFMDKTMTPERIRSMSKADLDSLLQKTANPRTGNMYTKTSTSPKGVGRNFEWIREEIARSLETLLKSAGTP